MEKPAGQSSYQVAWPLDHNAAHHKFVEGEMMETFSTLGSFKFSGVRNW
jgi:hypothetical protein